MFKKYKKKPVVIEAVQYNGTEEMAMEIASADDFRGMLDYTTGKFDGLYVETLEGKMRVSKHDYLIKEPFATDDRKYYPCKPRIFKKTYEEVV